MIEEELKKLQEYIDICLNLEERVGFAYKDYVTLNTAGNVSLEKISNQASLLFLQLVENKPCKIDGRSVYFDSIPEFDIFKSFYIKRGLYINGYFIDFNHCCIHASSSADVNGVIKAFKFKFKKDKLSINKKINKLKKELKSLEKALVDENNIEVQ